jgi:bla regulator protein BlaR1
MASVTSIVIFLIKTIGKNKFSSTWHYYIWLLVVIRLILPYSLNSSVSIFNAIDVNSRLQSQYTSTVNMNPKVQINKITNDEDIKVNINKTSETFKMDTIQYVGHILSYIWILTILALTLYLMVIYLSFLIKVKKEFECRDVETYDVLENCKKLMGIKTNIPIVKSKLVKTPCILGLFKPIILVPIGMIDGMSKQDKRYVFIHELVHYKRKDIFINWLMTILNVIHWFNPILYFCFKNVKEDCEISCDSQVLRYLKPVEYKNYGKTIINLTQYISQSDIKPWTCGIVSKSEIKRRIIMISKFKKKNILRTFLGIIALVLICFIVLTNANTKKLEAAIVNKPSNQETLAKQNSTNTNSNTNTTATTNKNLNTATNNSNSTSVSNTTPVSNSAPVSNTNTSQPSTINYGNLTEQVKNYILNGQGNQCSAESLNWSPTFLNQLNQADIESLYKQYIANRGQANNTESFAAYVTENAPIPSNWKALFEKDYSAAYKEDNYAITRYEYLGTDMYQVYVMRNGKEVPDVAVSSRTGYFHG